MLLDASVGAQESVTFLDGGPHQQLRVLWKIIPWMHRIIAAAMLAWLTSLWKVRGSAPCSSACAT